MIEYAEEIINIKTGILNLNQKNKPMNNKKGLSIILLFMILLLIVFVIVAIINKKFQ